MVNIIKKGWNLLVKAFTIVLFIQNFMLILTMGILTKVLVAFDIMLGASLSISAVVCIFLSLITNKLVRKLTN